MGGWGFPMVLPRGWKSHNDLLSVVLGNSADKIQLNLGNSADKIKQYKITYTVAKTMSRICIFKMVYFYPLLVISKRSKH